MLQKEVSVIVVLDYRWCCVTEGSQCNRSVILQAVSCYRRESVCSCRHITSAV